MPQCYTMKNFWFQSAFNLKSYLTHKKASGQRDPHQKQYAPFPIGVLGHNNMVFYWTGTIMI